MLLGGFPNEFLIYDALTNGDVLGQSNVFFMYIIAMVVLSIFSTQR